MSITDSVLVKLKSLLYLLLVSIVSMTHVSSASEMELKPAVGAPPCSDRTFWSDVYKRNSVQRYMVLADAIVRKPIPEWVDQSYLEYSQSGSRIQGERMIKARSSLLTPLVIAECLSWKGDYLPYIVQLLNSYMDEPSWTLPAHDADLQVYKGGLKKVDLAVASRAYELSLAIFLLKSNLPQPTLQRLLMALHERVWLPVLQSVDAPDDRHWWRNAANNWNAVCLKGVVLSALVANPNIVERRRLVTTAQKYIINFLAGYPSDGYAEEGPAYWGYGFGAFVELANGLNLATNKDVNLFELPKVDQIALYPVRFQMQSGNVAAFGDSPRSVKFDPILLAYLNAYLKFDPLLDWTTKAFDFKGTYSSTLSQILLRLSDLPSVGLYSKGANNSVASTYFFFKDEGVLKSCAKDTRKLCITMKAGGNGPSHAHNDIGSYVIGVGEEQPVGDVGSGVYSRKTFSSERADIRWIGSWGHPAPLVDGEQQLNSTKVKPSYDFQILDDDSRMLSINLADVYGVPNIRKLTRLMKHDHAGANVITLVDDFEFLDEKNFEVAVTTLGDCKVKSDSEIIMTDKSRAVIVTITSSAEIELVAESVKDEGLGFTRLAIRLKGKHRKGWVKQEYHAVN